MAARLLRKIGLKDLQDHSNRHSILAENQYINAHNVVYGATEVSRSRKVGCLFFAEATKNFIPGAVIDAVHFLRGLARGEMTA